MEKPARESVTGGERKDVEDILIGRVWWVVLKAELRGTVESRGSE
jgi:hypothetical protein